MTGSSYVLTSESGKSILIDLGMFQGTDEINQMNYEKTDFDFSKLEAAILTHAHLDHCGRLPLLLKNGFMGRIWMTAPTADLTELSLMDSAKLAKFDQVHALYDEDLAVKTIQRFFVAEYNKPTQIGDLTVTFRDAGHILGSASLEIEDKSRGKKIVFSGDLGNTPEELVAPTHYIDSADFVVMESTYGDRLHPDEDPKDKIQSEINEIEKNKGTLLIPAFSLERTQEVLHIIKHLKSEKLVDLKTPVFLDGPMAEKATAIYMDYPDDLNDHIGGEIKRGSGPFSFPGFKIINSHRQSERLRLNRGSQVIVAGSGMMVGGRIVGHAAHFLKIPTTRLLIVGYQGEETLGRELWEGKKEVVIDDKSVSVRAAVSSTEAMSSHADQGQLMDWLTHIKNVKKVILTHGEDSSRKVLAEKIKQQLNLDAVLLPQRGEEVSL